MHGLIFETSISLLAGSTRYLKTKERAVPSSPFPTPFFFFLPSSEEKGIEKKKEEKERTIVHQVLLLCFDTFCCYFVGTNFPLNSSWLSCAFSQRGDTCKITFSHPKEFDSFQSHLPSTHDSKIVSLSWQEASQHQHRQCKLSILYKFLCPGQTWLTTDFHNLIRFWSESFNINTNSHTTTD